MWISNLTKQHLTEVIGNVEYKNSFIGNKQYSIALVPCGFDIETTGEFLYIWTCSINSETIIGNTWDEFKQLLNMISEVVGLGIDVGHLLKVFPIFVHNFGGFEYQFMEQEFNFTNKFCIGKNALYGVVDYKFLFLDSWRICPNKLEDLAKMYSSIRKTHDLDYTVPRNTTDGKHLSMEELAYCVADTKILVDFARKVFDKYFLPYGKLPTTQNTIVKSMITHKFNENKEFNQQLINQLFLKKDEYIFIRKYGFRGAYCGSSDREYVGRVGYADFDSAYTSALVKGYYPMSKYRKVRPAMYEEFVKTHCCQMLLRFTNLKSKAFVHLENKNHLFFDNNNYGEGVKTDHEDKVMFAKNADISMTEIDFELFKRCYKWDDVKCLKLLVSERGYLPDYVILTALELYADKAKLKKLGLEDTQEYKRVKTFPSTIFGAMVQRLQETMMSLNVTEWYKANKDKILLPQWGVYITAHVRYNLVTTVLSIGSYYWLYSDTDSIYFVYDDEIKEVLDQYNENQRKLNFELCCKYGLDYTVYDDLGCFDYGERKSLYIDHFKTISNKTYIYHYYDKDHPEGDYKVVLSGIPKQFFFESYQKYIKENGLTEDQFTPIDFFEPDSEITYTRKFSRLVHNTEAVINGETMKCKQGVRIEEETITGKMRDVTNILVAERLIKDIEDNVCEDL